MITDKDRPNMRGYLGLFGISNASVDEFFDFYKKTNPQDKRSDTAIWISCAHALRLQKCGQS